MIERRIAMCMCGSRYVASGRQILRAATPPPNGCGWLDSFHGSPLCYSTSTSTSTSKVQGGLLKPFGRETGMCGPRGQLALVAEQPVPVPVPVPGPGPVAWVLLSLTATNQPTNQTPLYLREEAVTTTSPAPHSREQ